MSAAGIIVVGSINMDLVVQVARMPRPGETVLGGRFFSSLGGKGANQAVAAARAALDRVTFIASIGDDAYGRAARAALAAEPRLDLAGMKIVPREATGVALINVDASGENMISVASGANSHLSPDDIDAIPAATWRAARVFLASLEVPLATVAYALQKARQFDLMTILNPAPVTDVAGCAALLPMVDVLTPNEIESAILVGPAGAILSSAEAAARLQDRGPRQVVVTQGAAGCVVAAEVVARVAAPMVQPVDTTGAGDCFNGALAAALSEGRETVDAVRWACAAAALSVTRAGAIPSLPMRAEIVAFANKNARD